MKAGNVHTTRESWLHSATNELRPYFEKFGYNIPDKIRYAIAFTSGGKRGKIPGECWHPSSSADHHFEIILRADLADPIDVLAVLVHELVHTLLPADVKHGKEFRDVALRVGLEGPMRQTYPSPLLKERLQVIATSLGPLPHAKLDFMSGSDRPKKQGARYIKAECGASCGYTIRLIPKWAKAGLPVCPINSDHGVLKCDMVDDKGDLITHEVT